MYFVFTTSFLISLLLSLGGSLAHLSHHQVLFQEPILPSNKHKWQEKTKGDLVPLHPLARTNVLPPNIEEGLISILGPRFANEFIGKAAEIDQKEDTKLFGICSSRMMELAPCIGILVLENSKAAMLGCGLSQQEVCQCQSLFPKEFQNRYITEFCTSTCHDQQGTREILERLDYADYSMYLKTDPKLLVVRGDIPLAEIRKVKDMEWLTASGMEALDVCDSECGKPGCCPNKCYPDHDKGSRQSVCHCCAGGWGGCSWWNPLCLIT